MFLLRSSFEASAGHLSGKLVIEARDFEKSFGERVIVKNFSTRILRGDRVGLIGANGAGKTTLINLLIGNLATGPGFGAAGRQSLDGDARSGPRQS